MKQANAFFGLFFLLCSAGAYAQVETLRNDREGESYFITKKIENRAKALGATYGNEELAATYLKAIEGLKNSGECSFNVVDRISSVAHADFPKLTDKDLNNLFFFYRYNKLIDDALLKMLQQTNDVRSRLNTSLSDESMPIDEKDKEFKPIRNYLTRRTSGKCLTENFRMIISEYRKVAEEAAKTSGPGPSKSGQEFSAKDLGKIIKGAVKKGFISPKAADEIYVAIDQEMQEWTLTLDDYQKKRIFLRTQYPLAGPEYSDFVTERAAAKIDNSSRLKMLEQYDARQIILMGNVIKSLMERLASPKILIEVYNSNDKLAETIPLDPMERFRFCIKKLRKDMKELSTNSFFEGREPSYSDILAAGYEIGIVKAIDLEQVGKLEDVWNPQKTFLQKYMAWIRVFGSVVTLLTPPPWNIVPALGIIAIQASAMEDDNSLDHSLFNE